MLIALAIAGGIGVVLGTVVAAQLRRSRRLKRRPLMGVDELLDAMGVLGVEERRVVIVALEYLAKHLDVDPRQLRPDDRFGHELQAISRAIGLSDPAMEIFREELGDLLCKHGIPWVVVQDWDALSLRALAGSIQDALRLSRARGKRDSTDY